MLFDVLIDAVKQEANQAVAHWYGVCGQSGAKGRRSREVTRPDGDTQLSEEYGRENFPKTRERLLAKSADPERRAKSAAAKRAPVKVRKSSTLSS